MSPPGATLRACALSPAPLPVALLAILALLPADADAGKHAAVVRTHRQKLARSGNTSVLDAVKWLQDHKPEGDDVSQAFIERHARAAVETQNAFKYARGVPDELFLESVLPYAHFDEKREEWREYFSAQLFPLLGHDMTLKDAADAVQRGIWTAFGEPRLAFKANSTPAVLSPMGDLLVKRYGSCTAMSIFLADGLRACGIPARVVGVSVWNRPDKGNHNWVEVWFDDRWNFADAVPGEIGWNSAWFEDDARNSKAGTRSGIYTPTWVSRKATGKFVVPWRNNLQLPAIDITASYATFRNFAADGTPTFAFRCKMLLGMVLIVGGAWASWRYYALRVRKNGCGDFGSTAVRAPRSASPHAAVVRGGGGTYGAADSPAPPL